MNTIDAVQDKQVWNSAKVIQVYATVDQLQKPEQTILELLRERLPGMRMLDLGIGGGRTTVHFAPLVKEYVGSDYAENMVDACRQRFPNPGEHVRFDVIDATDMRRVPDRYFDLVLFSFNSIDCVAPEDRDKVFHEAIRVSREGGYFVFSSHNLYYLRYMYALKWYPRWRELLYQFYRSAMLLYYNGLPGKYDNHDFAIIRNGIEHFSLNIYYSKPEYQVQQLKKAGFRNIRAFSYKTGLEIDLNQLNRLSREPWIHYLCEI
ncbi:MAG: class I SAM-dependent methyltransferase [Saprospiraceae bacterium]|nr:class I SAM-dependent methyltransferase [Saprospiraceae bacterium]